MRVERAFTLQCGHEEYMHSYPKKLEVAWQIIHGLYGWLKKYLKIDWSVRVIKEMRSLREVLLLMSPECPRRTRLIWEVENPTCQRPAVATSCLAVTPWRSHLAGSAPWLILSCAAWWRAVAWVPCFSVLSAGPAAETPECPSVPPSRPPVMLGGFPVLPGAGRWLDGVGFLAWSWRARSGREKPHPAMR